ncbi:serine hydrolase [Rhodococcus phage Jflix2]|nr:serine hydrolase [Rhodococcus phage Jflix2]
MIKKILAGLGGLALAVGMILVPAGSASAATGCDGVYRIGVGGFNDGTSSIWRGVDFKVQYSAQISGQSAQEGVNALHKAATDQRAKCPAQHIAAYGHSEGAAVVHSWVSQKQFPNSSAVLTGDPKRVAGPGGPGFASLGWLVGLGAPLNGVDKNFGSVPVLQVCNHDDGICDINAGPIGYLFTGAHGRYEFDASKYPVGLNTQWYR